MQRLSPDEQRLALIALLIVLLFILAMTLAIGHIAEQTSYGLIDVIKIFGYMGATAIGWAFGRLNGKKE